MTFKHKLARRPALSRDLAMLNLLVVLAACAGEPTGPDAPPPSGGTPVAPSLGFRVLPASVTMEVNQRIRFRSEFRHGREASTSLPMSWTSNGGTIQANGVFHATQPGTYRVIGRSKAPTTRHRSDTSVVVVVPRQPELRGIRVTPSTPRMYPGQRRTFTAVGRLPGGKHTAIGVEWSATGGLIDEGGNYRAGERPGTYRVIATNTRRTIADTVPIEILPGSPEGPKGPVSQPEPDLPATRLVLRPANVLLATRSQHQFAVFGRTGNGDSIAVDVAFHATGGTITPTGLYTAGATAGVYRVVATSAQLADTATVTLAATSGGGALVGVPFGIYSAWDGTRYKSNTETFTLSIGTYSPRDILPRIAVARSQGKKLILGMTGGNHDNYKTDGVFDMRKWLAKQDSYNTAEIRAGIAAGLADGTIVGANVMDEPHNTAKDNSWGPRGTMTKARVDEMCSYVKNMFPTLPAGVVHPHDVFEPTKSYRVCDFIVSQYSWRKTRGDIQRFRDEALALGRRDGHAIAFSLNVLDGGIQAERDGLWACSPTATGGRGTYEPNCRMTAQQIREWGKALGSAGCALTMWRHDAAFMGNRENQAAFADVAAHLARQPAKTCRRI